LQQARPGDPRRPEEAGLAAVEADGRAIIAVASSKELALARKHGADEGIDYAVEGRGAAQG
jgi:NADPH:quinone reductase-like Zn-dependent oxidoreductase